MNKQVTLKPFTNLQQSKKLRMPVHNYESEYESDKDSEVESIYSNICYFSQTFTKSNHSSRAAFKCPKSAHVRTGRNNQ